MNFSSGGEANDSGNNQKQRNELKVDAKPAEAGKEPKQTDRKESRRTSGQKAEGRGRRKTVKEVKLEDELMQENRQEDDNFCKKRLTKLKKRGENDESLIILDDVVIKGALNSPFFSF